MITKVIMPQMSLTMQTGIVTEWLKAVGDKVSAGESLCVVEGDKATIDIESPAEGYLIKTFAKLDEEFPVKQPLALIGDSPNLDDYDGTLLQGPADLEEAEKPEAAKQEPVSSEKLSQDSGMKKASPVARRLAKENNIDLALVQGSGPGGLIGKEDVLAFLSGKSEDAGASMPMKSQALTELEKVLAGKMSLSNQEIPHFHLSIDLDVTEADLLRKEMNEVKGEGQHITLSDLFIWVTSRALLEHPKLNATFNDNQIMFYDQVNVGLAVDTPKGLVVVVIKDADKKSLSDLAAARTELVDRAVAGKQTPDDLAGGTFTITNLGMFGIKSFNPIIVPGQAGILGVGTLQAFDKPDGEGQTTQEIINCTLACDHRIVNGVEGAKFLKTISEFFANAAQIFK